MSKHKTSRGREFNMQAFTSNRGETIAVGNSRRNARGDMLGAGGTILTTSQEIANTVYNKQASTQNKKPKINPLDQEVGRKEIVGADGVSRWEVTFADGSVEIQIKEEAPVTKKKVKEEVTTTTPPESDFEIDLDEKL
jgi:hypothetical protein